MMAASILNPDGTVNLADAEFALRQAKLHTGAMIVAARRAESAYYSAKPFTMARNRALVALDAAHSHIDGALEDERRARTAVWEALNPEAA